MVSSRPDSRQNNTRKRKKRSVSPYRESDTYDDYKLDLSPANTLENAGMVAADQIVIKHLKKLTTKNLGIDRNMVSDFVLRILVSRSEASLYNDDNAYGIDVKDFAPASLTVSIEDESIDAFLIVRSPDIETAARLAAYVAFVSAAKFNNFGCDQFTLRLTNYCLSALIPTRSDFPQVEHPSSVSLHLSWPDPYNRNPHLYRVILSGDLSNLFHTLCRLLTQCEPLYESEALIKRTRLFGIRPDPTLIVDPESRLEPVRESHKALLKFISTG